MVNYQYTYFVGDLILLAVWLLLFLWRKDIRKEMLYLSPFFGIIGLLTEHYYIRDWWKPLTITGTPIGIEDFLFGFGIGGLAAVIYEEIFKKKARIRKVNKIKEKQRNLNIGLLIGLMALIFVGTISILNFNTFEASLSALLIPTLIIYIKRKDLIIDSLATAVVITLLSILGYSILNLISPGFIEEFWLFQNIGKILVFRIPLEEIIWFFLIGAFIGPLYEYWKEGKLINVKR